jgi:hypothetical protein
MMDAVGARKNRSKAFSPTWLNQGIFIRMLYEKIHGMNYSHARRFISHVDAPAKFKMKKPVP